MKCPRRYVFFCVFFVVAISFSLHAMLPLLANYDQQISLDTQDTHSSSI